MEYVQALGWLEEQEGGKDAADAIRSHVSGLNKESQGWRQKYRGSAAEVTQLTDQISTSSTDLDTLRSQVRSLETDLAQAKADATTATNKLKDLETNTTEGKTKFEKAEADLKTANDKIQELETSLKDKNTAFTQLETQNRELTRTVSITEAATTGGVQPTVLKKLVNDSQNLVVENNAVFIVEGETKTALREYADANWKEFVPALFHDKALNRIPDGPNGGGSTKPDGKSVVKRTLDAVYAAKK
jgi:chromosome segregation ATPase